MKITRIKEKWVSEVTDVNCANLSDVEKTKVYNLFADQKVLIFKDQKLNNSQLKDFCSIFGTVWDNSKETYSGLQQSVVSGHEDNFVETVSEDGLLKSGVINWHVDLTHFPSQLLPNRILYAVELEGQPSGTKFIDTIQGLDLIDHSVKEFLESAVAICKAPYKTPWNSPVRRPALQWHPKHNAFGLVADELFTQWLEGLEEGTDYKKWFRSNVIDKMITEETLYTHEWNLGDIVVYDNYSTIHYRDAFVGKRKLKRVTWDQNWFKK
jgi:taurine dioxygenase